MAQASLKLNTISEPKTEHNPVRGLPVASAPLAINQLRAMKMAPALERAMRLKMEQQGIADVDVGTSIDAVAMSVGAERPDLTRQAAPDGTVTLLFSDIEESTTLTERLGDAA